MTGSNLKLKSRELSFALNLLPQQTINFEILHKARHYHGRALCKISNDWACETNVMEDRDFVRLGCETRFGRISYIAQPPWHLRRNVLYLVWYMCLDVHASVSVCACKSIVSNIHRCVSEYYGTDYHWHGVLTCGDSTVNSMIYQF